MSPLPNDTHLVAGRRVCTENRAEEKSTSSSEIVRFRSPLVENWIGQETLMTGGLRTTGFVIFLGNCAISWCSKKQHSVSRSSTEAEYRAMADTASEIFWLRHVLQEIKVNIPTAPLLHCDNASAISLATNPVHKTKCKHVEVDVHFTREKVARGELNLQFVPSLEQFADIFTKGISTSQFQSLCCNLDLGDPSPSLRGDVKILTINDMSENSGDTKNAAATVKNSGDAKNAIAVKN